MSNAAVKKFKSGMNVLTKGIPAPDFNAKTREGKPISLSSFRGKIVWLIFYRYPGCPICNLHVSALYKKYEWVRNNQVQVITVFESTMDAFPKSFGGSPYPDFPFIADPDRRLYELYNVPVKAATLVTKPKWIPTALYALTKGFKQGKITGKIGQLPAHFLIAEDGLIDRVYYGRHVADHIPWEEVEDYAKQRKLGNWNPGKGVTF
jgi:thioredoxin-dependent peroxiredoxin